MTFWSKSSPPRKVSPLVDLTSKTPSPISRMETSKVPPPRSKTAIFSSFFLSRPYAGDAASILGGLTLAVVEIRRHGDHRLGDFLAEIVLCRLLHLLQDEGGDF